MANMYNEDLFEHTKMSFGDHLEELRICLVRAMMGLAVGFVFGLMIASPVVKRIEDPLQTALAKYHQESLRLELEGRYGNVSDSLLQFMQQNNLVYDSVYIERDELDRVIDLYSTDSETPSKQSASANENEQSEAVDPLAEPGAPSQNMLRTRVWRPMERGVTSLSAHEPFMIWLKAGVITGAVFASPWIFFQIWSFIAAGLYPHEKQYVYFFLPISLGLFFAGAALAFFFVFEPVLDFLFTFNRAMNIDPYPRISDWMSFVLFLPLGFGISFQLPLVMLVIERIGIVTVQSYWDKWRIAVLIICVISMVLTPADPISMVLMAAPLTVLYFGGIAMCQYLPKRRSPYGEGYDPQ